MPISINVPSNLPHIKQKVSLAGVGYDFTFKYNSRDNRLRLDIHLEGDLIVSGVKIMENQFLLGNYNTPAFKHGDILCARLAGDSSTPATLGNIGFDKAYELIYYSNSELLEVIGVVNEL